MKTNHGPWRLALDESTESIRISTPLITTIRRDQMPNDLRSVFLAEDIILLYSSSANSSKSNSTPANIRRGFPHLSQRCSWCVVDEICAGIIVIPIVLACLILGSFQDKDALAYYVCKYVVEALSGMIMFLTLFLVHIHYGSNMCDSVNLRCPRGVKFHCMHNLMSRMLSPSSLFLLKQPRMNIRSFFRYHDFFINGKPGGPTDPDVDRCIRAHAAAGTLSHTGLFDDGSHALLGLAPFQGPLTGFEWGLYHLNLWYRSYRDWKRWRIAALVCERLREQDGAFLRRQDLDYRISENLLRTMENDCSHKWLLVGPKTFSSLLSSQL